MTIKTENGKELTFSRSQLEGQAKIIGGRMKRADSFYWSWHATDKALINVFGLYRGRLGDYVCRVGQVLGALEAIGASRDAESIRRAYAANNYSL